MNIATQPETPLPWDGNRVSAGYVTNRDKPDDEVEKYRHLEELAELFLTVKRHHPLAPLPAHS
jgi:hypothetical protein